MVNISTLKKWYVSKTMWINILLLAGGLATWISGEMAAGVTITVPAALNAALRLISKSELEV